MNLSVKLHPFIVVAKYLLRVPILAQTPLL